LPESSSYLKELNHQELSKKKKKKNLTWIGPANVTKSTQEKSTLVRGSCFMRFKKGSPDERLRPSGAFASHRLC
jgi:hypothetical protein